MSFVSTVIRFPFLQKNLIVAMMAKFTSMTTLSHLSCSDFTKLLMNFLFIFVLRFVATTQHSHLLRLPNWTPPPPQVVALLFFAFVVSYTIITLLFILTTTIINHLINYTLMNLPKQITFVALIQSLVNVVPMSWK